MKRIFCSLFALVVICVSSSAEAAYTNIIRVGLAYGSTAKATATIKSDSGFKLGSMNNLTFNSEATTSETTLNITYSNGTYNVTNSSGKSVYSGANVATEAISGTTNFDGYNYYGAFGFNAESSGKLTVINYANIEDYVKGVLPYEMSASWPIEALKAQAVCARSFVLGNLNKHKSYGFDVCNTTNCQVYHGTERADANTNSAADQTKGQILMYDGKLAVGYFFSSSGGATENNENVWGGTPIPYLRGVNDIYEDASASSKNTWSVTFTAEQIASKLKSAGYSIGTVADVKVTKRTEMDNVNEVTVTDTTGKSVVIKNDKVRTVFGLNSIRYTINGDDSSSGGNTNGGVYVNGSSVADGGFYAIGANGAKTYIGSVNGKTALTGSGTSKVTVSSSTKATTSNTYTFSGTGWGHNVGMSQYGARSMAKMGFNYTDILKFYFTGITISQM